MASMVSVIQLVCCRDAVDGEQPAERAGGLGAREDVAEAAVEAERHEQADGEECDELDDQLERDRRHHALVLLARIDVARPEQDREHGHESERRRRRCPAGRTRSPRSSA